MPGPAVSAKRVQTGDVRSTTANETGNFIFPLVDSGEYEVTCTAAGFKTEIRCGIVLELNQKARIDFQLQVGQQAAPFSRGEPKKNPRRPGRKSGKQYGRRG
ncbi:MAG: carboxypeptidase regulatory-like domain-containing protein, partial [Acidobacteria bacterium]|nr:carboxypeptidase regulatory-like domain-containing protein [Acidobacteriota bacterium]